MEGHKHCPNDCEHPQEFFGNGKWWCGRCAFMDKTAVEMILCPNDMCEDRDE